MSVIGSDDGSTRALDIAAVVSAVLFVALLVIVRDGAPTAIDERVMRSVLSHRTDAWGDVARVVTRLGSSAILYPLAVAATIVLRWRRMPWLAALAPLVSLAVCGMLVTISKHALSRPRPPFDVQWVTERAASFPSGHTANSTAFYVALGLVVASRFVERSGRRVAVVAGFACIPFLVGLTRLVLAVHWTTDVVAGWALGTFVATVSVRLLAVRAGAGSDTG